MPDRYASRCKDRYRHEQQQGTALWGALRGWDSRTRGNEQGSVLVSASLDRLRLTVPGVESLRLDGGRLAAAGAPGGEEADPSRLVGVVLRARSSSGPTEVAICGAEPAEEDAGMVWYRIEAWNPVRRAWENPCAATDALSDPRAVAVGGVWNASGARQDAAKQFTFACENGAIAKCIQWGYKPWAVHQDRSLAGVHQACTRMARADYCGNGRTHTVDGTVIDIYDAMGILAPAPEGEDNPNGVASFEAPWAEDGATCINQLRTGAPLDTILQECPGRFTADAVEDPGSGDRCQLRRAGAGVPEALIRNRLYRSQPAEGGTGNAAGK